MLPTYLHAGSYGAKILDFLVNLKRSSSCECNKFDGMVKNWVGISKRLEASAFYLNFSNKLFDNKGFMMNNSMRVENHER